MSFDFPASPTPGQIFTPIPSVSYMFQSPSWKKLPVAVGPPAAITIFGPIAIGAGTGTTFSGLPADTLRMDLEINNMCAGSGSGQMLVTLGTAAGIETTGYEGAIMEVAGATPSHSAYGANFTTSALNSSIRYSGVLQFRYYDPSIFRWLMTGRLPADSTRSVYMGGAKTLTGLLTQLRVLSTGGNFAAGSTVRLICRNEA